MGWVSLLQAWVGWAGLLEWSSEYRKILKVEIHMRVLFMC